MTLDELIRAVNSLIDDQLPSIDITRWINDGIAEVNIELDANFPFLDLSNPTSEPSFPEKWQRTVLIPYAAAKAKQQDSSQFEYNDLYSQFQANLQTFKSKYPVPEEFKDVSAKGSHESDIYENPPFPHWNNW